MGSVSLWLIKVFEIYMNSEEPTSGEGGYLWDFFYHRGRTKTPNVSFFKSQQPAPTREWDEKSLTFNFLKCSKQEK